MPENMGFTRKLKNLIVYFSRNSDNISEASTNVTDKKNDEDDLISDNDSHCELFRDIFPDEVDMDPEKNSKGLNTRIKSKTPLGDMLNSLLRKKSSTQIFEGNESDMGESSSFITFPVVIENDLEQLKPHPLEKRNIDYHENEPNLGLINDPKGSFDSSHTSASSVNNLVCTDSTAQHEPKIIDVRTSIESSRPPMFNNIADDPEAKRRRRAMRNERRIRKVSRALKRESKYKLST